MLHSPKRTLGPEQRVGTPSQHRRMMFGSVKEEEEEGR
jgi:hypothetical protein